MKMKIASLVLLLAVLVAGSAWAQDEGPVGAASPSPLLNQNHYKCYDIPSYGPFHAIDVRLRDQFGKSGAVVVKPVFHCNPVDKNEEGIPYPDVHLLCYEIFDQPYLGSWALKIVNQFGSLDIKTDKARLLCVPSYKFHI